MKNKILQLLMLFCFAWVGGARAGIVEIGNGANTQNSFPIKTDWTYSMTQQLFTAEEIGMEGTINAISFHYANTDAFSIPDIQVYMKNVDKNAFNNSYDMVQVNTSDKVWEGTFSATGEGWITISLDTPFEYDGTSNLLVCFYSPTNGYLGDLNNVFYCTSTTDCLSIAYYGDASIPDINNVNTYSGYSEYDYRLRANIRIDITNPNIVEIGTGTSSVYGLPVNMYYNYSLTQQIYTAEEIGRAGTIKSIAFDYAYSEAFSMPDIQVYMKNMDKSEFTSDIDMVDLSDATFVYEGTFSAEGAGWATLTLDHPFEYDGTSNLMVCFYDPTYGYPGNAYKFRYTSTTGYTSLAYYSDSNNPNLDNLNTYSGLKYRYQYHANIRLDFTPTTFSCEAPGYITVSFNDFNLAYVYWENVSSGYWVETKEAGGVWELFDESIIGLGIAMANLDEATTYYVRVRSACEDGGTSAWTLSRFTTPLACPGPINLHLEDLSTNHAWLSWGVPSGASSRTEYKKASDSDWILLNDHTGAGYILYNLEPMTIYDFRVLLYCQNGYTSDYETIQFTTAAPLPLTETFSSTSLPTGWRNCIGLLDDVMTGLPLTSSTTWKFGAANGAFDGDNHAYANIYSTSSKYWLLTPFVVLTENCQLGFDVAYTAYSGTMVDPATNGDDDKFVILISTDFGASWEILRTYTNDGSSDYTLNDFTPQAQKVVVDLSDYDHQTAQLAFYVESTVYNADNNLHIDNVNVDQVYTVNDGTVYSNYVPVYGTWVDKYSKSQFIIPAGTMAPLTYSEISKLTFYCNVDAIDWGNAQFEVYMAEVPNTTFASDEFVDWESLQLVRSAGSLSVVGGLMEVELDTPFNYTEGNLMIGVKQTVSGTYKSSGWYGISTGSNTAIGGYENSKGIALYQFLPKTTFTYTTSPCKTPTNFAAEVINSQEVAFNWTPGEDQSHWQIAVGYEDTFDPSNFGTYLMFENVPEAPPYTLSGLQPMTTYKACVRAHCGNEAGPWSRVITFTPQDLLTVYDGTEINNHIPAYIYYFDEFTRSQFIIPAEDLTELLYSPITSMTFYTTGNNVPYTTVSAADVYLKEVNYTEINAFEPKASANTVYSGYLVIESTDEGGKMTINFNEPYYYQGGNLLVGVENTDATGYKYITFYGQAVIGASISGSNASSMSNIPAEQQNFIPKTTFGYTPSCDIYPLPYSYGFEDEDYLECWTMLNCDPATARSEDAKHTGNYGFKFHYTTNPPQYLISPKFSGNTGVAVSFYYAGINSSYTEHFEVGYSTTTKAPKDFIWSDEVTVNDNTWRLYEESFPVGTKYVAIKCTSDDQMYLLMDDFNFVPVLCDPQDVCHVNFELTDSYGDTWNDAAIKVVDVATNTVLGLMTNDYNLYDEIGYDMECTQTKSLAVCDGQELRFEWVSGYYDNECSYVVTDNNGEVIFSGTDAMGSSVNYTVSCSPSYIFLTSGNWNDGSNWNVGTVPEAGSDVIIRANAVIPAGCFVFAPNITIDGGSITVAEGGQLRHYTYDLVVTMEKSIIGYDEVNDIHNYYLLAFPFDPSIPVPEAMIAEGCDLYMFDENYPNAEWRNNNLLPITMVGVLDGYLFASPVDIDLSVTGATMRSVTYYINLPYSENPNNIFNGWYLFGNFYTCDAYIYTKNDANEYVPMNVMFYNEEGELVTLSAGPIPPMQAYFIKLTEPTAVYFKSYRDPSAVPVGAVRGKYTVNAGGNQVYFSRGNLQYTQSTQKWSFMEHQYDVVEAVGQNVGENYANQNVISLFGWGTSGYNHGAVSYQPWNTNNIDENYCVYGDGAYNLYDQTGQADWGYNAISNGGNATNQWRTLTRPEWEYVFNTRTTNSGIRFVKAIVNNVKGMILLPDDWDAEYYTLNNTNDGVADFSSNTISLSQWSILEQYGAVFLPYAATRNATVVPYEYGTYWSASRYSDTDACCVDFTEGYFSAYDSSDRSRGRNVRLVCPVGN